MRARGLQGAQLRAGQADVDVRPRAARAPCPAASAWRMPRSVSGRSSSGQPSAASACRSNQSMTKLYAARRIALWRSSSGSGTRTPRPAGEVRPRGGSRRAHLRQIAAVRQWSRAESARAVRRTIGAGTRGRADAASDRIGTRPSPAACRSLSRCSGSARPPRRRRAISVSPRAEIRRAGATPPV